MIQDNYQRKQMTRPNQHENAYRCKNSVAQFVSYRLLAHLKQYYANYNHKIHFVKLRSGFFRSKKSCPLRRPSFGLAAAYVREQGPAAFGFCTLGILTLLLFEVIIRRGS